MLFRSKDKEEKSLIIFDDFDTVKKSLFEKLNLLLNSILQIGRSSGIYCIVSKHVLNDAKYTKIIWLENTKLVVFVNGLTRYSIDYALKKYLGLSRDHIDYIMNLHTRWVCINRNPLYAVTENKAFFLK